MNDFVQQVINLIVLLSLIVGVPILGYKILITLINRMIKKSKQQAK